MAADARRIADLEAEVAELRVVCDDVRAIRRIVEAAYHAGQYDATESAEAGKYRAAAAASQARPRHLLLVPGGAR
jgi:hypothetical protein